MRVSFALIPLFGLLGGLGTFAAAYTRPAAVPAENPSEGRSRVKLAVLVVFDQMRGDYPLRWQHLYGPGGFRRLLADGAWFTDCHYPYGVTTTGPGHASILTGACPDRHGIVNNNWIEYGRDVYCAASTRYTIMPPVPETIDPKTGKAMKPPLGGTPDRLLSETVADVLKQTYGAKAKVFGLSLKDRSAILPTGKHPDGAFWFDGRLISSTYYPERSLYHWSEIFNRPNHANLWFGKDWSRFRPDLDYARFSGPDDAPGEGAGILQGKTFPHPMTGGLKAPGKAYYDAFYNSPYGNEFLLKVAKQCILSEELGRDGLPDLLVVSFSSNDAIGHTWGPDSQEVLDVTLRTDALLADFLRYLDASVGAKNYLLALTADHGICPLPEGSAAKGRNGRRVSRPVIQARAEKFLRDRFSDVEISEKTNWIESIAMPWIYLNPRLVEASGRSRDVVASALARHLMLPWKENEIAQAFTREELAPDYPEKSEIHRRMKRSFYPSRCGDVCVVLKPFDLPGDKKPTDLLKQEAGTTHGSPYDYDRFVPLIVYGPGIPGGPRSEPVTPQAAAAIFSHFLGLRLPADADFPLPAALVAR